MATRQAQALGKWALAPSVVALSAWAFVPLALALYFAFLRYNLQDPDNTGWAGFSNFYYFFKDPYFLKDLINTVLLVAGTIVTASQVTDVSPFLQWTLAIIAGGGVCALVQTGTVALRSASSGTTLGLTNPLVSTVEMGASAIVTFLAIVAPVVAFLVILAIAIVVFKVFMKAFAAAPIGRGSRTLLA